MIVKIYDQKIKEPRGSFFYARFRRSRSVIEYPL